MSDESQVSPQPDPQAKIWKRPEVLKGSTKSVQTGCGKIYVTVNIIDEGPFEIFLTFGKSGGCATALCESIGRLVSATLRAGLGPSLAVDQLKGISCPQSVGGKVSCSHAVAIVLEEHCADHQS